MTDEKLFLNVRNSENKMLKLCISLAAKLKRLFTILLITLLIICIYFLLKSSYIPGIYNTTNFQLRRPSNTDKKLNHNKTGGVYVQKDKNGQMDLRSNVDSNSNPQLLNLTRETRVDKELLDIMGLPPIKFDPAYRNPCFIGDKTSGLFSDGKLHCLPYFYIIGVKKSGTSDLFYRISNHPEFREPGFKESQWFPRIRFGQGLRVYSKTPIYRGRKCLFTIAIPESRRKGIDNRSIKYFISLFDKAAAGIKKCSTDRIESEIVHNCVTGEGTPGNLHMHTNWDLLPGNEGLTEPRYTNFHYIKHITPDAKLIIIFRDPVTRLFSDYLHEVKIRRLQISVEEVADMFHKQTSLLIRSFETCFESYSMRRCIYDEALANQLEKDGHFMAKTFRASFYAFFMEELYSVFRKDQILPIEMKTYITKTDETLANTFQFLKMSHLTARELSKITSLDVPNSTQYKTKMNQKTKDMLYNFYRPYNEKMAHLMNDNGYLYPNS